MTLFIDTHSEVITVALLGNKNIIKQKKTDHEHSKFVLSMIKSILEDNHLKKSDIKEILVVNGPGSFTGIRIGVVIAKTLSYTLNIKIKTISSLETYGISDHNSFDVIFIEDSKGFYYTKSDFKSFEYLKKDDFNILINKNNYTVSNNREYDFIKILDYSKNLPFTDSRNVNPIYIKRLNI